MDYNSCFWSDGICVNSFWVYGMSGENGAPHPSLLKISSQIWFCKFSSIRWVKSFRLEEVMRATFLGTILCLSLFHMGIQSSLQPYYTERGPTGCLSRRIICSIALEMHHEDLDSSQEIFLWSHWLIYEYIKGLGLASLMQSESWIGSGCHGASIWLFWIWVWLVVLRDWINL